jgi:predicted CoA-binding protein
MSVKREIDEFVAGKTFAMAGVSRDANAFSTAVYRELKAKGYRLLPVNPNADTIEGDACYASLSALPEKPDGVLVFTQPAVTASVVRDAAAAGITRLWIQQGAESAEALELCREHGLSAISKRCIMMFAEPVGGIHKVHRFFARLFGSYPR